ncbi:nitroreductase family protein [Candidatus Woesearchaeota archaeon]|nr:MAG: nitroreductase family protein [Candidatus Woesearchaeota archaeon]
MTKNEEKEESAVERDAYPELDVLDAIYRRRSVRKYKSIPIDIDLAARLVDAAIRAPSAGNLQSWKFVYVSDRETRHKISEACFDQHWMNTAPAHIVVCSDPSKLAKFYGVRGELKYSIQECAAAIENLILAAEKYGLGTCWVGAFDENKLKSVLGIPDGVNVEAVITVGYPDEKPSEPHKYKLHEKFYIESWGAGLRDALSAMREYAWSFENKIKKKRAELKEDNSVKRAFLQDKIAEGLEKGKGFLGRVKQKIKKE